MLRKLYQSLREFRRSTLLTPVFVVGEVALEALIPYVIAMLVNDIRGGAGTAAILGYAWKLVLLSLLSLRSLLLLSLRRRKLLLLLFPLPPSLKSLWSSKMKVLFIIT